MLAFVLTAVMFGMCLAQDGDEGPSTGTTPPSGPGGSTQPKQPVDPNPVLPGPEGGTQPKVYNPPAKSSDHAPDPARYLSKLTQHIEVDETYVQKLWVRIINETNHTLDLKLHGLDIGNRFAFQIAQKSDKAYTMKYGSYAFEAQISGQPPYSGQVKFDDHKGYTWIFKYDSP
ncbi:MAG: hypothetical protein HQL06_07435 [Nitrospirae bacterium]|nr:hypothetical protein [Nitrospirota bacterium]